MPDWLQDLPIAWMTVAIFVGVVRLGLLAGHKKAPRMAGLVGLDRYASIHYIGRGR
jgi:hypothetical protein